MQASTAVVLNQNGSYSTYLYTAVAESIVAKHAAAEAPLFLYFPLQNVHSPLEAPIEWIKKCPAASFPNVDRRTYCAMTLLADSAILNLTTALAANNNMLEDTVLIVAGDNGGLPHAVGDRVLLTSAASKAKSSFLFSFMYGGRSTRTATTVHY
jgi:arylsulfatase A-like enzyme